MKKFYSLFILLLIIANTFIFAQNSSMNIFGSAQSIFFIENKKLDFPNASQSLKDSLPRYDSATSSFALQQMDLFLQNNFDDNFSYFADIEFKLNYSSEKKWGQLNIQEAWVNYSLNDNFNVKFGMLFPEFNNLNSIKNRLNLMPYIMRPTVYEQILSNDYSFEDFIPEKAFLQISGYVPINSIGFDYALYMGNCESSYYTNQNTHDNFNYLNGIDTKSLKYKLYGARVGLKTSDDKFKLGFSITHDYNNTNFSDTMFNRRTPTFGDIPRIRLGADFSIQYSGFKLDHETIYNIYYDFPKDSITSDNKTVQMGQFFTFTNLLYNFSDNFFSYVYYARIKDKFKALSGDNYSIGGGYRFNSNVTLKFQYLYLKENVKYFYFTAKTNPPTIPDIIDGEKIIGQFSMAVSVNF